MASIDLNTVFNGTNGFQSTFVGFNEASNYILGDMLLAAIFIILIFMLRNYEFRDTLMSSSTVLWIVSILLWAGGLTDFTRVTVCFSVLLVALLYTYVKE